MCLITFDNTEYIADKNIEIFKVVKNIFSDADTKCSLYQNFHYKKNKLYYMNISGKTFHVFHVHQTQLEYPEFFDDFDKNEFSKLKEEKDGKDFDFYSFNLGFHSATTAERLSDYISFRPQQHGENCEVKGIIPAGSKYHLGLTDLIVSNQIILNW